MGRCENCPASWEDRSYEGECNDFGCQIMGHGICDNDCRLTKSEIEKRLQQLEDYEAGKIKRPQWIANRFMRELDSTCVFDGKPGHTPYPPVRMWKGVYYPIYGPTDMHYQSRADYRRGYEDAKAGKEMRYDT